MSRPARRRAGIVAIAACAGLLASCAGAPEADSSGDSGAAASDDFPVTIDNCGHEFTVSAPPERAVALDTRTALALISLGLEDKIVGTARKEKLDVIPEQWRDAYKALPTLAEDDPTRETLLAATPDFVYAAEDSSFTDKGVGTVEELEEAGITPILHSEECPSQRDGDYTWDTMWDELLDVSRVFGVEDKGEEVVADQRAIVERVSKDAPGKGLDVLIWDMNTDSPLVVAGGGGPQLFLDALGLTNVFGDIDNDWATVSWERVLKADPDVIIVTNAPWSSAEEKTDYLEKDAALSQLSAVKNKRYVITTYSTINTPVRYADTAQTLAKDLAEYSDLAS